MDREQKSVRGGGLRLGSVLGVRVIMHPSWFLILILAVVWLGFVGSGIAGVPPVVSWLIAPIVGLTLFGSVLIHELAHALVARSLGVPVEEITVLIFGGAAPIKQEGRTPKAEALITLAGPAASGLMGVLLFGVATVLSGFSDATVRTLAVMILWLGAINLLLAVLNLIPGFPMDGGRLVRAVLWARQKDFRLATRNAAQVGRAFSYGLLGSGIFLVITGQVGIAVTTLLTGWVLWRFASMSHRHAEFAHLVRDVSVRDVMERDVAVVNPNLALDTFAQQYLASGERDVFAVSSGDELIGTIDATQLRRVPKGSWPTTRVREVMSDRDAMFALTEPQPVMDAVGRFQDANVQSIPVVDIVDRGRLIGMVTREGLVRALRRHEALRGG